MSVKEEANQQSILVVTDVVDDSLERVVRLAQRKGATKRWNLKLGVRSYEDMLRLIKRSGTPDMILYYANEPGLQEAVEKVAAEYGIVALDIFDPVFRTIDVSIHEGIARPTGGRVRTDYLQKIEAIEFAGRHDDGKNVADLDRADLVLIGVSRTSKTPLSLYLANMGLKVANIPIVYGIEPPQELFRIPKHKIIGLTISPTRLWKIRQNREGRFGLKKTSYSSLDKVEQEVRYAENIMKHLGCPIIDVSQKAIEETADEILKKIGREDRK